MNSKSLFTTVLRNFQWARRNRGYCPTTYIILEAMQALLPLPRLTSQSPSRSLITVTKKRFSSSSDMAPEMDPTAQHNVLRLAQDHSVPSTCSASLSSMMASVSLNVSRTISPFSSSTTNTSSGFAILEIITNLAWLSKPPCWKSCLRGSAGGQPSGALPPNLEATPPGPSDVTGGSKVSSLP